MRLLLLPAVGCLLLYAPGRVLLRYQRPPDTTPGGSQLLREVLLSVCCTSWLGFILAETGLYSLPTLVVLVTMVAGLAWVSDRSSNFQPYGLADLGGATIVTLVCLWVAPPLDTRILGSDSSGYLASGAHLARHGSLVIHDPTLAALSPDMKRAMFPSVAPDRGSPPYLRLPGSLVLRTLDGDEVLPAFHHLLAVWVAVGYDAGGSSAAEWTITVFAALSVWAMVECAAVIAGAGVALTLLPLVLLLSPQYWYSRFLMPEIPGQFFLWGGLWGIALCAREGRRSDAILSGLAIGMAGLMRTENAAFLALTLAMTLVTAPEKVRPHRRVLLAGASLIWLHAGLHLTVFRTHYFGNLRAAFAETVPAVSSGAITPVLGACTALVVSVLWWRRRSDRRLAAWYSVLLRLLVLGLVFAALWGDYRHGWPSIRLLVDYVGVPTVLAGGLGLLASMRNSHERAWPLHLLVVLTAVVFAQVMLAPHATPVPIWTVRRALTVLLPSLGLGVALIIQSLWRRGNRAVAALAFLVVVSGQLPSLATLRWQPYYRGGARHVEAIATLLPQGATLLFDPRLVGSGLAQTLWAERDLPAYFVPPADASRIYALVTALRAKPLYWLGSSMAAPPNVPGVGVTPIALYEFVLATPALDAHSEPSTAVNWEYTIGVYLLRVAEQRRAIETEGRTTERLPLGRNSQ